ncbi:hypothetical protein ACFQH8_11590 [Halomicroarcula sp. GCM10025710]
MATEVKQTNDNDATSLVTADEFAMSGSTATLGSGRYYVHDIEPTTTNGSSSIRPAAT